MWLNLRNFQFGRFLKKSEKVEGNDLAQCFLKINDQKISEIKLPLASNHLVMTKDFDIDQNF